MVITEPPWRFGAGEVAAWRAAIRQRPCRPYDCIDTTPLHAHADFWSEADRLASGGEWHLAGDRLPSLRPPVDWTHPNRSFEFYLQSWRPLNVLLAAHGASGDPKYLAAATTAALDWLTTYQLPLFGLEPSEALAAAAGHTATKAWYDMGVGLRVYRLAYIAEAAALDDLCDDATLALLLQGVLFHQALLGQDAFFVSHTNHGLYQALGQLAAARRLAFLPAMDDALRQARSRCAEMLERSFFPSGAHREHSPGYHYMILGSLVGARDSGLIDDDALTVLAKAEEMLGWMAMPDGTLAPIGDTDPRRIGPQRNDPVPQGLRVVDDAGYVFFRHGGTYLAQTAGFHSRTHKQSDHFSFVWCEDGREVLIDPGRFGYLGRTEVGSDLHRAGHWYSDPRRVYVEKTRAHNCVEIDGADYPRTGRFGKPFGSGLRGARVSPDGLLVTHCEGRHFGKVRHCRNLILAPGRFLLVLDWLRDASETPHDFRQWFHLAQDWVVDRRDDGFTARLDGGQPLHIVSLLAEALPGTLAIGQIEPVMLGWRSDRPHSLVPSPTASFDQTSRATASFATLLCRSQRLAPDSRTRVNASLSRGRLWWRDDDGANEVEFSRDADQLEVRFRCHRPDTRPD